MLTKERIVTISKLAFPVSIALSSTMVMSLIDLAMVSSLGNEATAAVGLSVFGHTMLLAILAGIAPAVQGLVARRRGENSSEPPCLPLNGGLAMALIVGIPLTVVGYSLAPVFFSLVSSDPGVIRTGIPFLRVLYLATVAAGMNVAFKGHWTGMERPNVHMSIVLFMNVLNFCGNYVLIGGRFGFPALGATGAAVSTAVSLYVGAFLNVALIWFFFRRHGFLRAKPDTSLMARIFRLGMPATVQEFFYSAGFIVFFWIVGQVGTAELAATNVQVRVSMVLAILSTSLGSASATLVSRTVGEGDPEGAAQWGWDSGKLGVIVITLLALPLVAFPRFFLSMFLSDPHAISIAVRPWQLLMSVVGVGSLIYIFAYTLISVGDGNRVAMISFGTQWLIFLPAVWIVGPHLHYGLLQISFVQMIYGAASTALITAIWAQGRWQKIAI
jgi:multidrug resistance protein, MATE family